MILTLRRTFDVQLKLDRLSEGRSFWLSWTLVALVAITLLPSYLRFGVHFWYLPQEQVAQSLSLGGAFLALSLLMWFARSRRRSVGLHVFIGGSLGCFVLTWGLMRLAGIPQSRAVFLIGAFLGITLAAFPRLFSRRIRHSGLAALLIAIVPVFVLGLPERGVDSVTAERDGIEERSRLQTMFYPVGLTLHDGVIPLPDPLREQGGGAIAPYEDGFMLVTADGDFYKLSWQDDSLVSEPLGWPSPFDREQFASAEGEYLARFFRITDLLVDDSPDVTRVYLAHHHWNAADECVSLRVSENRMVRAGDLQFHNWPTLFESQPCLRVGIEWKNGDTDRGGGRLAQHPQGLLLTVGDYGSDGYLGNRGGTPYPQTGSFPQQLDNSYGKILMLDSAGESTVFSLGHRNPQGLLVDDEGRIWSTEHGPKGGDELNLIVRGANYGWPLATYGVDYDVDHWPLSNSRNHGKFQEPSYAFVPSIGISQVIQLGSEGFLKWSGDLLISSLRDEALFRVRMNGGNLIYSERIPVGARIRDLAQSSDGRIVLWTDSGQVVSLRLADFDGASLYYYLCSRCHSSSSDSTMLAPPLEGIVGSAVAARGDYAYSSTLLELGGVWSEDRLDDFLKDPTTYAPGTSMEIGVMDSNHREALIRYLSDSGF